MHYLLFSAEELYPLIALKTKLDNLSWVYGKALTDTIPPLEFSIDGTDPFEWCDYLRPAADIPLFSSLLRRTLEGAGVDNIEYYPATVTHRASGVTESYWAANVLGLLRGMDREQSEFTSFRESDILVRDIEKLVLDDAAFGDVGLCRLADYDLLIVVDETVKAAIEASGVKGVVLTKPEDWDGFAV